MIVHCNRSTCGARWVLLAAHGVLSQDQLWSQLPIPSQRRPSLLPVLGTSRGFQKGLADLLDDGIIFLALPDVLHCSLQCDTGSSDIEWPVSFPGLCVGTVVMLALAVDNVEIIFLDHQGPSGQKTFHRLCRQPLQERVINAFNKSMLQYILHLLHKAVCIVMPIISMCVVLWCLNMQGWSICV